jgi:hypothetical protein
VSGWVGEAAVSTSEVQTTSFTRQLFVLGRLIFAFWALHIALKLCVGLGSGVNLILEAIKIVERNVHGISFQG